MEGHSEPADASETSSTDRSGPAAARRSGRGPTVFAMVALGIVAIGLAVALVAGVGSRGGDDSVERESLDPNATYPLPEPGQVDPAALFAAEINAPGDATTTLADELDGRPVLLNLWASTCAPCIEEMPWLDSVADSDDRIQILGVSTDVKMSLARGMAERTEIGYGWFQDPSGAVMAATQSVGLPDTFLFGSDGRLLGAKVGAFSDEAAIRAWIDEHLEAA